LQILLQEEGQFSHLCEGNTTKCQEQTRRFEQIFASGAIAARLGLLPLGVFLDFFGPRFTVILFLLLHSMASLFMAFSQSTGADLFFPAMVIYGVGGQIIQVSQLHLSNLFSRKATVVTFISVALTASFWILPLFKVIHDNLDVSREAIFISYSILAFVLALLSWFISVDSPFKQGDTVKNQKQKDIPIFRKCCGSLTPSTPKVVMAPVGESNDSKPVVHFFDQIFSLKFIFLAIFFSVFILKINMYMANFTGLFTKVDPEQGQHMAQVVIFCMPGVSIISVPVIGLMIDAEVRNGTIKWTFLYLNVAAIVWSGLLLVPHSAALIVSSLIYAHTIPMIFGTFFNYIALEFGFSHYGRIVGTGFAIAGTVALLQFFLITLAEYLVQNIIGILVCVPLFLFPLWLHFFAKRGKYTNEMVSQWRLAMPMFLILSPQSTDKPETRTRRANSLRHRSRVTTTRSQYYSTIVNSELTARRFAFATPLLNDQDDLDNQAEELDTGETTVDLGTDPQSNNTL